MRIRSDVTGRVFGKLTAIKPVGQALSGKILWLCRCECGNERTVKIDNLTGGHTRSCGCLVSRCKRTDNEAHSERLENTRRWRETHAAEVTAYSRIRRGDRLHGLTLEQIKELSGNQGHVCAVCKMPSKFTLQIDHDHKCCPGVYSCGRCVRGLLCISCNRALGLFHDNPEMLAAAISYLVNSKAVETERRLEEETPQKLQSELIGNYERSAEMTDPVTIQ